MVGTSFRMHRIVFAYSLARGTPSARMLPSTSPAIAIETGRGTRPLRRDQGHIPTGSFFCDGKTSHSRSHVRNSHLASRRSVRWTAAPRWRDVTIFAPRVEPDATRCASLISSTIAFEYAARIAGLCKYAAGGDVASTGTSER